jgi:hypothetical protein
MKNILLSLVLFASLCCSSQSKAKTYSTIYLYESVDNHFSSYYKNYVAQYFFKTTGQRRIIERDPVLDTVAAGRSEYSIKVFKESSKTCSFKSLLDYVPKGPRAHMRFYDNPSIFKEPKGCVFPVKDNLSILKRNNLEWSSELFVETVYSLSSRDGNLSSTYLINKNVNYKGLNDNSLTGDTFLDSYLSSTAHRNAIHKYGNWKFGCKTMFIISKYYNEHNKMWKYDVFSCHTIIIVKNYSDSNVY